METMTIDPPSVTISQKHTKSMSMWSKLDMAVRQAPASSMLLRDRTRCVVSLICTRRCQLCRELTVHCRGGPRTQH